MPGEGVGKPAPKRLPFERNNISHMGLEGNSVTNGQELTAAIARLERERAEIDQALTTLRRLAGVAPDDDAGTATPPNGLAVTQAPPGGSAFRRDAFFGMSAPEAVRAYLLGVKQPRTAAKIASEIQAHGFLTRAKNPANSIRTTLTRLEESGEVVQINREWGLAEWYKGRRNLKVKEEGGKENEGQGERDEQQPTGWRAFLSKRMKEGATMQDAATEWRAIKAEGG